MKCCALLLPVLAATELFAQQDWRTLPDRAVRTILSDARSDGKVGGSFDLRVRSTDRSYNYKLRATWITPGIVAGAVARAGMLSKGWTKEQAETVERVIGEEKNWLVLVKLDPREGSGIIPKDWISRFGPQGAADDRKVPGTIAPEDGVWLQIASAFPRDYAYDRFLVKFPHESTAGRRLLESSELSAELTVQIYQKQGRVVWKIPAGLQK